MNVRPTTPDHQDGRIMSAERPLPPFAAWINKVLPKHARRVVERTRYRRGRGVFFATREIKRGDGRFPLPITGGRFDLDWEYELGRHGRADMFAVALIDEAKEAIGLLIIDPTQQGRIAVRYVTARPAAA